MKQRRFIKKLLLIFFFLIFSSLVWPKLGFGFWEDFPEPAGFDQEFSQEKNAHVFSDSGFTQPLNHFAPGQKAYVRVEFLGNGDQEKNLRILDSDKREVRKIVLNRAGAGPFVFTASFSAPEASGVYYVDIKINSGQGAVFSSQENINVSGSNSSVSVSSKAKSTVVIPTVILSPTLIAVLSPIPTVAPPLSFFSAADFLKKAFHQFLTLLSGLF